MDHFVGIDVSLESCAVCMVNQSGTVTRDAPMLPELLDQIPPDQEIASVTADGAFDTRKCHDAIAARGAAAFGGTLSDQWRSPAHS